MKKPAVYTPEHPGRTLTSIWETPVVVIGRTWLPLAQIASWFFFSRWTSHRNPEQKLPLSLALGALHTLTMLGSEWCHNLSHVAAAHIVDRPMDALRITWGMPLCVYYDLEDADVSPRQHIARASGGPIFNAAAAIGLSLLRRKIPTRTISREIVDVGLAANLIIPGIGLLPYPGLDGGPILKWGLVDAGYSPEQADHMTQKVDGVVAAGLAGAAFATVKRRPWLSLLLAVLSALGLGFALGWIREN